MKINNKKIAILFLLISLVLFTSCVVSAADTSNGTSSDTQEKVNTPEITTTHSDDITQSTSTQEQTTSDTNNQVSSNTQTNSQSTSQSSSNSNTQTTSKESSSNSQSTNQEQSTTQSTTSQSSTQNVSTDYSVSTQSVNTEKQLSQEESNSNNQTTTESNEDTQNDTQINSVDSSQLVETNKELKTATYTASSYSQLLSTISTIKSSSSTSSNTINLVSGTTYKITSTIIWGSSNSKTLTINGNGAIIDGQGRYGFLVVNSGYTITLKNMTIQNCYGNLNFDDNNFQDCTIHNVGGTVTISNVTFKNNQYGVLYNDYNETSLKKGNMTITDCTISDNKNSRFWGMIYNVESNMTITNTIIKNNNPGDYIPSVIYNDGGTLKMTGCTVSNHSEYDVIVNVNTYYTGKLSTGVITVDKCVFENNSAYDGGVFCNSGTLTITNSNFTNNKAYGGGKYYEGGVIYSGEGTVTISSSIFTNNEANKGKVLYVYSGSAKVTNNTFIYTYSINQSKILNSYKSGAISSSNNIYKINLKTTSISIDDTTANTNKSKTFTAYIKASDSSYPTGSVKISIDGKTITSTIGSSGKITFSYTFTKAGTYSVTISYAGNSNYDSSSKTFKVSVSTVVVDTYITTSNKNATATKSTNLYGYVYGYDGSIPTGSVTITVNGKSYTSSIGSDGYVHISYTFGSAGNYSVKISYAGSSSYRSSSSTFTVTVKSAPIVNTYITTVDKSATVNKSTNLYGYVKASDGTIPKGSVTFTVNDKNYTSSIGSDGYVHISYIFGSAKNYTVKITYAGSSSYSSSSSTFTVKVTSNIKDTYITTNNKNATVNKSTNLYGYIKASDNSIPKGSVTFTVNGKDFTSTIGSDGYVHLSYIFGSAKNYTVKITYTGSSSYSSSSSTFTVTVKSAPTVDTYITTVDKSATVNKSTNLYGYVKANDGTIPKGSVTFTVNGKDFTSTIGSDGYVHLSYIFGSAKNYTVKISYAGSSTYSSSNSSFTVTVKSDKIDTYITTSNKEATVNKSTNLYGYVKASDNSIPTGSVTFTVNSKNYTSTIGSDGYVNLSYKFVNYGNYTVKISYAGNNKYSASSSTFTVNIPMPTSSTVSSYTELYNTIQTVKTYTGSGTYTINLKDGSYKITNTINWGSTKGVKNLVINGNGVNIYGSSQKQFMNIATGYTVTINNLGIINGNATNGGSIYNSGNLTLNNCVFNNSKAKDGGAIYTSGVLSVSNCKFNNNQATRYGGSIYICSGASTTIKSSTFTNGYADVGGAMYNNGYSTTIDSSTFTSNMATTGGAIYNKNYIKISDSTYTTNSAESGGSLYNSNSGTKMIVDNTKFNNNTALYGGAIFNYKNANLNVTKTTFSYNQANNGEAVRNKNATATLTNNTITFTSDQQSNTIVTTDGKTTTNSIIYNRVNKLNATINMASSMFVTGNSGTITGNITDSNNKLITDSLTVTFSINGKNITTQTIKNGKINVTLSLSSFSSGVYNITTTLKESSNYTSSNATTVLFKDKKHSIVTTSTSGKNGETVTLTAYISNKNGTRATSGTATFKLNGVTIKDSKGNPIKVSIKNGVATYTYTIPTGYSAKDYKLTAVADADGRIENTAKLTIEKTDQKLTASTSMFVTGNTAQLTGTIVDINGKTTTRDTKVAIKINGKTVMNTVVTNGKLDVKLDLSKYNSGAYTIEIVLGENGCYNTGYANMTLIKNMKNSIVVMPTNNTAGSNATLYTFVTDSNGNRQSSGTVTFKIDGTTVGTGSINNGVANITYNTLQYYTGSHTLTVSTTVNGKTLTNSTTLQIKT